MGEEEDSVQQAEGWRMWLDGASGESVTKKTGQHAHVETEPKPGKEDKDDHDSVDGFAVRPL